MTRWPVFADDERAAAMRVLESGRVNYWTGQEGRAFEREFADYLWSSHAVALANGTLAIELALHALGIGPGDDVIVPARTFVGTATAVVACGARPVVADVERASGNLSAATIEAALTPATRCVIPVHVGGWPCDLDEIMELAEQRNLFVVEDCAQAHGARWGDDPVGVIGHVGAFSFCQDKIMTTAGEGGMLVTHDDEIYRKAWGYKDHGRSAAAMERAAAQGGYEFKYVVEDFGTNWRMTEVQAAIGRVQLTKLDSWVKARRANAAVLDEELRTVPGLRVVEPPPSAYHAYYKYYAYIEPGALVDGWTRARVLEEVNARDVTCLQGTCCEIYREEAFVRAGWGRTARLPVAAELGDTALMLLVDPTLTPADMRAAASVVREVMVEATGGV
ncbi:MAG: DegT/DnrJ/EryC1/StrS aminotransferase family protein [Coriobacteriia bacterium]|nr:DegT/DnrJ/EryC1/StrS aminotransferase family protein [Coriobacteriia bacterium]